MRDDVGPAASPTTMRLRVDNVFTTVVDDETVILDAERSLYLTGNPVASVLLNRLVSGASFDDLVAVTLEQFDVGRAVAEDDVRTFVGQLRAHQLLDE